LWFQKPKEKIDYDALCCAPRCRMQTTGQWRQYRVCRKPNVRETSDWASSSPVCQRFERGRTSCGHLSPTGVNKTARRVILSLAAGVSSIPRRAVPSFWLSAVVAGASSPRAIALTPAPESQPAANEHSWSVSRNVHQRPIRSWPGNHGPMERRAGLRRLIFILDEHAGSIEQSNPRRRLAASAG